MKSLGSRQAPQMSRQMFAVLCYAYIFLGICSVVAGGLVYALPLFLGSKHPKHIDAGLGFIIVVLIGFGLARIATALFNLRRLSKGRSRFLNTRTPDSV